MANGITIQRGQQYDRTLQQALANGETSPAIGAKTVTVTLSGDGAVEAVVLRHPAMVQHLGNATAPPANSPHWAEAAPDEPLEGTAAPGAALVADYGAAGFSWWAVKLISGGPVTAFLSVDGVPG